MGIFTRFKDIVTANINSLLDKAEDPEKMLRLMVQEMEDTLIELKVACSAKMADEIKLGKDIKDVMAQTRRWEDRARLALLKGKEDLAKEALVEKKRASEYLNSLNEHLSSLSADISENKEEISTLELKLEQAKEKLKTLAEKEAKYSYSSKSSSNLNERFEEMEMRINRKEAWTKVNEKKSESAEEKFSKFEEDAEIEAELEKLKKEIKK